MICGGGGAGIVDASLLVRDGLRSEARGRRIAEADILPFAQAVIGCEVVCFARREREGLYSVHF